MRARRWWAKLLAVTTVLAMTGFPELEPAFAGFDEGKAAYNSGNFAKAFSEWRPLAEQGDAHAQERIGDMYAGGEGVPQNREIAIEWYLKAAEQGRAGAQNSLGLLYESGDGAPQDAPMAVSWYRKAAAQRDPAGQFALGNMYAYGLGVPRNKVVAYALFNQSMLNRFYAQTLQAQMSASQRAAGERLTEKLLHAGKFLESLDDAVRQ